MHNPSSCAHLGLEPLHAFTNAACAQGASPSVGHGVQKAAKLQRSRIAAFCTSPTSDHHNIPQTHSNEQTAEEDSAEADSMGGEGAPEPHGTSDDEEARPDEEAPPRAQRFEDLFRQAEL